jgi:hypothetical protein
VGCIELFHQQAEVQAGGAAADADDVHEVNLDFNTLIVKQKNGWKTAVEALAGQVPRSRAGHGANGVVMSTPTSAAVSTRL